jgi:hypothetical protein
MANRLSVLQSTQERKMSLEIEEEAVEQLGG